MKHTKEEEGTRNKDESDISNDSNMTVERTVTVFSTHLEEEDIRGVCETHKRRRRNKEQRRK